MWSGPASSPSTSSTCGPMRRIGSGASAIPYREQYGRWRADRSPALVPRSRPALLPERPAGKSMARSRRGPGKNSRRRPPASRRRSGKRETPSSGAMCCRAAPMRGLPATPWNGSRAMAAVGLSTKAARHRNNPKAAAALTWRRAGWKHHAARRAELLRGGRARPLSVRECRLHAQLALCLVARERGDSPVRGKVGIAPLPASKEGNTSAALGGWQLAVSQYSRIRRRRPRWRFI